MAGLVFTAVHTDPSYRAVRQYLHTFDRSGKELSPVERLAFSLLLARSEGKSVARAEGAARF